MNSININQKGRFVKSDYMVVGVDIGKRFHVAVVRRRDGSFTKAFKFSSDASGFTNFWDWLNKWYEQGSFSGILIGLESTGHYWETLAYWLRQRGIEVVQVNPLHTHKAKDLYGNNPGKTDSKDAWIIADLVSQGKFLRCIIPQGRYADLRQLVLLRKRLVTERTRQLNNIHRVIDVLFPEFTKVFKNIKTKSCQYLLTHVYTPDLLLSFSYKRLVKTLHKISHGKLRMEKLTDLYKLAKSSVGIREGINGIKIVLYHGLSRYMQLNKEIKHLEGLIEEVVCELEEADYLRSVKGVGLITAAVILGETGGLSHYSSAEEVIKLAGLNLYERSSGKHRGKRRITKRGRSVLREGLYLAAVSVIRHDGVLRDFYERLINKGKARAVALIAVACKLMRLLFALVRARRFYAPDHSACEAELGVV